MQWDIINTQLIIPICNFCGKTTNQMARFMDWVNQYIYICSSCARFVKDAMNKWEGLKSVDYIENIFDSELIDQIDVGHGESDPMGKFTTPIGKDLTLDNSD